MSTFFFCDFSKEITSESATIPMFLSTMEFNQIEERNKSRKIMPSHKATCSLAMIYYASASRLRVLLFVCSMLSIVLHCNLSLKSKRRNLFIALTAEMEILLNELWGTRLEDELAFIADIAFLP